MGLGHDDEDATSRQIPRLGNVWMNTDLHMRNRKYSITYLLHALPCWMGYIYQSHALLIANLSRFFSFVFVFLFYKRIIRNSDK